MPEAIQLAEVEFASVSVTERTTWTFAELSDSEGRTALVELTCGDETPDAVAALAEYVAVLKGRNIPDESGVAGSLGLSVSAIRARRPLASAVSALRTAIVVLQAQSNRISLTEQLGGSVQDSVELYANINRSMGPGQRAPSDFAAAAERAVVDGFVVVKCAPFDEVTPPATLDEVRRVAARGIQRVAAVREAVGPDVRLLVDCHSRFETGSAPWVAEELAKSGVGWLEEPVQPTRDAAGLSEIARAVSIPVAGGEIGYGASFFTGLVAQGAVQVVMPDVKYCGGVAEAVRAGRSAGRNGGQASLHSPSGPVSQLASAHAAAATPGSLPLEHAVYEAPWRSELLSPPERIEGGRLWFPGGPGLGASLDREALARYSSPNR